VTAAVLIWAGLLIALLVLFVAVARRMAMLTARTRELERIQRSVESLDRRLGAAVDPLVGRLDGIRRHPGDVEGLARDLGPAQSMLRDLAVEARALQLPAALAAQGEVMAHETERAVRAADLVAHGLETMLAARGGFETGAQTSLKRGALNLRHAREVFGQAAREIATLQPADLAPGAPGVRESVPNSVPRLGSTYGDAGDPDLEGPFEPRM
jgi:hypothetical protein